MSAAEPDHEKSRPPGSATGPVEAAGDEGVSELSQLVPPATEVSPERPGSVILRDHFRPPLGTQRHWHSFHSAWATALAAGLNQRLPEGYFAEPNVQFGIEIDVATFEENGPLPVGVVDSGWSAPAPVLTVPLTLLTDVVEVQVFTKEGGPTLVGAVELVSPANKDRPAHRDAFLSKCAAYLQQGVGLAIADVVTDRSANLHDELLARVGEPVASGLDGLYATAYRPIERDGQPRLDVWQEPLAVGQPLPVLPLWLRGGLCLPLDLPAAYTRACQDVRLPL
jgi:hypothetical protein